MGSRKRNRYADYAGFLALHIFTRFWQYAPRNLALLAGSFIGAVFWTILRFKGKRLDITLNNMRKLYPGAPDEQLKPLARRAARHFGRFLTDGARIKYLTGSMLHDKVSFEGLEHYVKAHSQGKGVMLATAHFGHFEVAAAALAAKGYPVWSVIREVDNPGIDASLDESRCGSGLGVIKKEKAAREILGHLRAGHTVTIHIDQNASFNYMYIPFFGQYAATFTTPAVMSLRTGAPVLSMLCRRDDLADKYYVRISPPVEHVPTENRQADIRQISQRLNQILEDEVRQAPEQWFWFHNRWKKTPAAEEMTAIEEELAVIENARAKAKAQ